MASQIERRKFLATLGGAAAGWPLAARAQQPAMPVVGFLRDAKLPEPDESGRVTAFHQGMKATGYVDGQNVAIEYRSAEGQTDRFPLLVADLLRREVAVIVGDTPSALAAKAATTTVPIVFVTGGTQSGMAWSPASTGPVAMSPVSASSRRNLGRSSLGSCVSCGREPRALPCSSIPNSPLPSGLSQRSGLRLRPWGSKLKSCMPAPAVKSIPPLQRSSNARLACCTWVLADFCTPNGNGLSRWRPDTGCPRCISGAKPSLPVA